MTRAVDTEEPRVLREALARRLADAGHSQEWIATVRTVARHLFVPVFHQQDHVGQWVTVAAGEDGYLEGVYADRALTTQLTDGAPTSSSSEPDLMLTMLDALDVRVGHRVLEIGTGTGYNAALLSHRLGDANVTTVDVDSELTVRAAERLAAAGYQPHVVTGDGAAGVPERGPFDRIIATCGMQSIPPAWIEQAADGALMVVPIGWGLARVTVQDGHAHGRFLPAGAYFMARRAPGAEPRFAELADVEPTSTRTAATEVDRLQFPLALALPGYRSCTWSDENGAVSAVGLWTPDGSTATAHVDGTLRQIGPRHLWDTVEELHQLFDADPVREDFGLTVNHERQWAWWRTESGPGWDLSEVVFA